MKHFGLVRATLTGALTIGLAGAALLAATPAAAFPVLRRRARSSIRVQAT